ncbi:hypothetical protein JCM10213_002984 [Rhodosporidiobolus nylandii]
MLLSLPSELVERVVRLPEPDEITLRTYGERQDTLRALCLVSKALRAVVQPILEEVLFAKSNTDAWTRVKEPLAANPSRARHLRLCADWQWRLHKGYIWKDLLINVLPTLTMLRQLHITSFQGLQLSVLQNLPHLTRLVIVECAIEAEPFVLPRVVELACLYLQHISAASTFLSTTTFPSLQTLVYTSLEYGPDHVAPPLPLRNQLSCLIIDEQDVWDGLFSATTLSSPSCLVHCAIDASVLEEYRVCFQFKHTRVDFNACAAHRPDSRPIFPSLQQALEARAHEPNLLNFLVLNTSIASCSCEDCSSCQAKKSFLDLAESRGITVRFEDFDYQESWLGSKAFEEYLREQRENEELDKQL